MSAPTHPTAALHQAAAIQHRMDGTFRRDGNTGEPAQQALTDFAGTPAGVLVLYIQDEVFDLERKLVGVAIWTSASVREPLHAAFLITIEDLIAGLAGDAKLNTPSKASFPPLLRGESVTYVSGTMCYLCLRSVRAATGACRFSVRGGRTACS